MKKISLLIFTATLLFSNADFDDTYKNLYAKGNYKKAKEFYKKVVT